MFIPGDFDEIKQDISSFRYEMLNHVSVRQMETMETKERLDRLYGKLDSIVMHQKQLVRMVSSGLSVPDDAIQPLKDLFSTSTESFRSSIGMDSFTREDVDDDDAIADGITFTVKATNKIVSDDQSKLGVDSKINTPKRVATLRNNNTQRQNAEDNTSERELLTNDVDLEDIKTQFSVSKECG